MLSRFLDIQISLPIWTMSITYFGNIICVLYLIRSVLPALPLPLSVPGPRGGQGGGRGQLASVLPALPIPGGPAPGHGGGQGQGQGHQHTDACHGCERAGRETPTGHLRLPLSLLWRRLWRELSGRLLTNRGPDRSGSCLIWIWQPPDPSGSCLISIGQLPDQSGSH